MRSIINSSLIIYYWQLHDKSNRKILITLTIITSSLQRTLKLYAEDNYDTADRTVTAEEKDVAENAEAQRTGRLQRTPKLGGRKGCGGSGG